MDPRHAARGACAAAKVDRGQRADPLVPKHKHKHEPSGLNARGCSTATPRQLGGRGGDSERAVRLARQAGSIPRWTRAPPTGEATGRRAAHRDSNIQTGPARPYPADVPALLQFPSGPVAMQHIHADPPLRERRRRVAAHEWPRRHDRYAPWTIVAKSDGRTIGWGALYENPFDPGWGARWPTSSTHQAGAGYAIGEGDYLHQRRRSCAAAARGPGVRALGKRGITPSDGEGRL